MSMVLGIMIGLKRYLPKIPNVLTAVAITTLLSWQIGFEGMGGKVVGSIPEGLPALALPVFDFQTMLKLVGVAVAISIIGFMEAISIARAMAATTRQHLNTDRELIGQGMGNIAGSLFQAYPSSGSFSRSAVNINAGAVTGFGNLEREGTCSRESCPARSTSSVSSWLGIGAKVCRSRMSAQVCTVSPGS